MRVLSQRELRRGFRSWWLDISVVRVTYSLRLVKWGVTKNPWEEQEEVRESVVIYPFVGGALQAATIKARWTGAGFLAETWNKL